MKVARILIVEDDRIVARDIRGQLTRIGHEVVGTTAVGEAAALLAETCRPDLVLMDIRLEGALDGIEAARQIKKVLQVPVIYLTANADDQTVQRASDTEPFGYLLKPFEDSQLRTAIEIALTKHAAEQRRRGVELAEALQQANAQRRAEDALRESEARFRGTFENAGVGIAHCSTDGRFLRVNQKYCDIIGHSRESVLAMTFKDLTHPEDASESVRGFQSMVRGELPLWSQEKRCVTASGKTVWISVTASMQCDEDGTPVHSIGVIQDISERKRLEEALRQAKDVAEAANRAKDDFLANVSHEIRTPMNAIVGMTQLVLDSPLGVDQRQSLHTVLSATNSLLGTIDGLLDYAKIEAGKLELEPTDFALRAALADVLQALNVRAFRKNLRLSCTVAQLPDALTGDVGRLRQVLMNLIGNAIKFTDVGHVSLEVERAEPSWSLDGIHGAPPEELTLRFTVRDTGIGIPRDKQEVIFRAFEQEDTSTTRRYGGTGLGLTIAARLVKLMDGELSVESTPGVGSAFTFTARFCQRPSGNLTVSTRPASNTSAESLPILVAEDNVFNAQLLEQLLTRRGHQVQVVSDGRAALAVLEQRSFALLFLDLHMPELDGFEVVRAIRERERSTGERLPVVAFTARSRSEDRERCLLAGMDDFLTKPIRVAELWAAVSRLTR